MYYMGGATRESVIANLEVNARRAYGGMVTEEEMQGKIAEAMEQFLELERMQEEITRQNALPRVDPRTCAHDGDTRTELADGSVNTRCNICHEVLTLSLIHI